MIIIKKYVGNIIQGIFGFAVILLLWGVGAVSHHYHCENFEIYYNSIFYYLPNIVLLAMPVFLLNCNFIGKRYNFKVLYFSALLGVLLPVFGFIGFCIFSDDGNILSWIFAFTLGLLLSPFHRLAWSTFDGVWTGDQYADEDGEETDEDATVDYSSEPDKLYSRAVLYNALHAAYDKLTYREQRTLAKHLGFCNSCWSTKKAILKNGEVEYIHIKPITFEEISHSASRKSDKASERTFYTALEKMKKHIEENTDYCYIFG